MYKTLNNHVAKFIIEHATYGNCKFSFIRLYNAYIDEEFTPDAFARLFRITRMIINECHNLDDILFAIDDLPLVVKVWYKNYRDGNYN